MTYNSIIMTVECFSNEVAYMKRNMSFWSSNLLITCICLSIKLVVGSNYMSSPGLGSKRQSGCTTNHVLFGTWLLENIGSDSGSTLPWTFRSSCLRRRLFRGRSVRGGLMAERLGGG